MKMEYKMRFGATVLALLIAQLTYAQQYSTQTPENRSVYREINDPSTGSRWLLMIDSSHPGGPGRWLRAEGQPEVRLPGEQRSTRSLNKHIAAPIAVPVIHAGDRVIVEEHSDVAEARLEGVALGPAAVDAAFKARLVIGGKVVGVVATASGHAVLQLGMQPGMGERP